MNKRITTEALGLFRLMRILALAYLASVIAGPNGRCSKDRITTVVGRWAKSQRWRNGEPIPATRSATVPETR